MNAVTTTSPTYQSTFGSRGNWGTFVSSDPQLQEAAQQIMPMYQARLGGLQGPVSEAMRTRGIEQIQSQYGTALRSAMNQAGAQGIRGPAAVAMQQDIRDQMGRATAGYQRDLTIADWDAKRQALADYYNTMQGERGIRIGTPIAQQQLVNTQQGFDAYNKSLEGMSGGGRSSNPVEAVQEASKQWSSPYVPNRRRSGGGGGGSGSIVDKLSSTLSGLFG